MKVVLEGNLAPKLTVGMVSYFHFVEVLIETEFCFSLPRLTMVKYNLFLEILICYLRFFLFPPNLLFRYTYCGLATMNLINEVDRLDLDTLMVTYNSVLK